MKAVNLKKEINCSVDEALVRVTDALKSEGFGILTRIDLHSKIKEKLNKEMAPVIILGACNPNLAYQAYLQNSDVTSLLPCNVVIRELALNRISIEVSRPSALMEILGDAKLVTMAKEADSQLFQAMEKI